MTELDKIIERKKKLEWCKELPVPAANALIWAGADSKERVKQFIDDGGNLRALRGIGKRLEAKILEWIEKD